MSITADTSPYTVRRPLTDTEIKSLTDRIDAAGSVGDLLTVAIRGVFDALLSGTDKSFTDYTAEHRIDPTRFAIPRVQWEALAAAVTRRADQWGSGALVALELVNVFPGCYDDDQVPAPVLPHADYRPHEFEIRVTRSAADEIAACDAHLATLASFFGTSSPEFLHAQHSWHRCLMAMFSTGNGPRTTVGRDGPLSLLVTTSAIQFAVVFHARRPTCAGSGCAAQADADGTWRPPHPDAVVLDHIHDPTFPLDAPQQGQWTLHS